MKEIKLKVFGMMCNGCETRLQNVLKQMNGVEDVKASYKEESVKIIAKENVSEFKLKEKIENLGYKVK